jgi:hypothetical protein
MPTMIYTELSQFSNRIDGLIQKLKSNPGHPGKGLIGFDGFVDTMIRFENPASMADFGPKVAKAAGIATSAEVKRLGQKYGGNGPLLTVALSNLFRNNIHLDYIGALGKDSILPIFKNALEGKVHQLYSFADPSTSDCLEFTDGKVMLSDLHNCSTVTWEQMVEVMGMELIQTLVSQADFVVAVNWGKVIHAGKLWIKMAELIKTLKPKYKITYYMDLAEFEPRSETDKASLTPMFKTISEVCHTIISLNLKEGWQLAERFGGQFYDQKDPAQVVACAEYILHKSGLDEVIIHPNSGAAMCNKENSTYVVGPFCSDPLISTGAGDHFGSGALAGHLMGFDQFECMLLGGCTSGYFVRTGISPSFDQIIDLLQLWKKGELKDRI